MLYCRMGFETIQYSEMLKVFSARYPPTFWTMGKRFCPLSPTGKISTTTMFFCFLSIADLSSGHHPQVCVCLINIKTFKLCRHLKMAWYRVVLYRTVGLSSRGCLDTFPFRSIGKRISRSCQIRPLELNSMRVFLLGASTLRWYCLKIHMKKKTQIESLRMYLVQAHQDRFCTSGRAPRTE